ncbi:hypothetical protein SAZ11_55000 [Streptomyces sp. FXJ1.4098]|nr:hypothetical protein [Streptomyces sp. FXJ1.4098]
MDNARLRFHDDLPEVLRVGYAQPGAEYSAAVRLSDARGAERPHAAPGLRRMAVRVRAGAEGHTTCWPPVSRCRTPPTRANTSPSPRPWRARAAPPSRPSGCW